MSVIKASNIDVLRPVRDLPLQLWGQTPPVLAPDTPSALDELQDRLSEQFLELEKLRAEARTIQGKIDQAFQDGEAQGRIHGRAQAEDRYSERLEVLRAGVAQGIERLGADMASLERLALTLSREALAKLLNDAGHYPDLIARMIGAQLDQLASQTVLRIEVSLEDFADHADLAKLRETLGHPPIDLQATPRRKSGECFIKLRLGGLEIGVDQQWEQLSQLLADMAAPEDGV